MVVTYLGKQFFKIQFGDTTIAINPPAKDSKFKSSRFGADIVLVTTNHKDYNGADTMGFGEKMPFVITGAGEYEIKEIFIKGINSESQVGKEKLMNTIYVFSVDKIKMCFLGALSSPLKAEAREAIDEIDMVFVPIGGEGTLSGADAYTVASSIEPKVVIPMDYEEGSDELKKFLKEGDAQKTEPIDKLTVKLKDLEGKDGEIILLSPSV